MAKLEQARLTHRAFLKWCGLVMAGAGAVGTSRLVSPPRVAFAQVFNEDVEVANGNLKVSNATSPATLILYGDSNNVDDGPGQIDSRIDFLHDAGTYGYRINVYNDVAKSHFALQERAGGTYYDRLYVQGSSGNVGIGVTSPVAKLDVAGDTQLGGNVGIGHFQPVARLHIWEGGTNIYTGLKVSVGTSPSSPLDMEALKDSNFKIRIVNQDSGRGYHGIDMRVATSGQPNGYLRLLGNMLQFNTTAYSDQSDAAGTNRLTILNDGKVGIGLSNPEATLHLASGTLRIGGQVIAGSDGAYYAP